MRASDATTRIRISPEQKDAIERVADDRDMPVSAVFGEAINAITGVPDTLKRHTKRGRHHRRPTN
jgi:predicted transcriptional regulator